MTPVVIVSGASLSQDRGRLEIKIEALNQEVLNLKKELEVGGVCLTILTFQLYMRQYASVAVIHGGGFTLCSFFADRVSVVMDTDLFISILSVVKLRLSAYGRRALTVMLWLSSFNCQALVVEFHLSNFDCQVSAVKLQLLNFCC